MTSHKINFTLPDMPNSINFQISFTVNSEESKPMLNVEHSTGNVQEMLNLQDKSSDLDVKPLSLEFCHKGITTEFFSIFSSNIFINCYSCFVS